MKTINWPKALLYACFMWLIIFGIVSGFVGYGMYDSLWTQLFAAVLAGFIAYLFARSLKPASTLDAFVYGLIWVVVAILLDAVISARFNSHIFSTWTYWVSQALVLCGASLAVQHQSRSVAV